MRFFNTTGPCDPRQHYTLPPERRLPDLDRLIGRGAYFVVHAPRQTGKTTTMQALATRLTEGGTYTAIHISCETASVFPGDVFSSEQAIGQAFHRVARHTLEEPHRPPPETPSKPGTWLQAQLTNWTQTCPRPLVLLFDEIDALEGEVLRSVLRQLRDGYNGRTRVPFPHSVILCGVRDVRDYKIASGGGLPRAGSASPFNIKAKSLRMANFTEAELRELYGQHTTETGQPFTEAALAQAWTLTRGQPWLVNALASEIVDEMGVEPPMPITADHLQAARERLILARATHIDSLAKVLHDDRIRRVIEPILVGSTMAADVLDDDLMYARDLGLVVTDPTVRIANPLYAEVIPRALTHVLQANINHDIAWYQRPDGSLDMTALLEAFQEFFARHSESWQQSFSYHEAGPHLILMAWLQRLVNGKGRITREFAIGSGRADLVIHWKGRRYVLELKIRRDTLTVGEGVEQLSAYLDRLGEEEGWLIVFDPRDTLTWDEKLYDKTLQGPGGKVIHLFGA